MRSGSSHRRIAYLRSPKIMHVADAGDALQRVLDVDVEVVAEEQRVVLRLLGVHADRHHEAGRLLLDGDAGGADFRRHAAERLVDAVLHVDLREILIARDVERDVDRRDTGVGARRGHVEHALDAVDGLLERRGDRRSRLPARWRRCRRRVTVTCGGASAGYCATGMVGMATAPARMRTSEQTDARIGRRMKVSTIWSQATLRHSQGSALIPA